MEALEALECPVCLNRLDQNHKVLQCQHTFCTNCLEILHDEKNGHMRCPECRHLEFFTSVAHLPTNVVLMRLLQSMDNQAKKEEEKKAANASSSDDEPVVVRKKVVKPKKKFRKIRSQFSDSDDEEPVIKESESEAEEKKPVIESESETEQKEEKSDSSSSSSASSSSSESETVEEEEEGEGKEDIKKEEQSGSATDNYFSDSSKKKEETKDNIFDIVDPLASTPNKESRKRSGRLAERNSRVFQMPNRKSVLDSIPSTSSPLKACISARKHRPRRRVNNYTKVNSSYNHDPDYTSSDSQEAFIKDEESETAISSVESGSWYSDDSTKPSTRNRKKPARKKRRSQQKAASLSEAEASGEENTNDSDGTDEYVPPAKKSRIKRKPEVSEEERWDSSDSEKFNRREPISKRQRKRVRESIESGSRFEQLKKEREEKKRKL